MRREDLHDGQEVLVTDVNVHGGGSMHRRGQDAREPWDGKVVHVGRKIVTIRYGLSARVDQFRIETQRANDQYGHLRFRTREQYVAEEVRERLIARLRLAGFSVQPVSLGGEPRHTNWQLEQIAILAELTREQADAYQQAVEDEAAIRKATGGLQERISRGGRYDH